ncbi:unnamed protein product [Soboliphyme baturini]|uniref:Transposase n=1 Tax=Soboliphyme baturini TaxID=241478 RepID=A0A183IDD2_9BILA|nr:unnamed protein product [Soboliphyme baturini]
MTAPTHSHAAVLNVQEGQLSQRGHEKWTKGVRGHVNRSFIIARDGLPYRNLRALESAVKQTVHRGRYPTTGSVWTLKFVPK